MVCFIKAKVSLDHMNKRHLRSLFLPEFFGIRKLKYLILESEKVCAVLSHHSCPRPHDPRLKSWGEIAKWPPTDLSVGWRCPLRWKAHTPTPTHFHTSHPFSSIPPIRQFRHQCPVPNPQILRIIIIRIHNEEVRSWAVTPLHPQV